MAKITTGLVRLSYANIFQPAVTPSGDEKYSASLIIPKDSNTVDIVKKEMKRMLADPEVKRILGNSTKFTHELLRDGDEKGDDAYAGSYFINAKANIDHRPKVFTKDMVECADPEEVYSGCYVQAVISLYAYNKGGNKGIGASLIAIRKIKDGEHFSGLAVSADDFDNSLLPEGLGDDDLI